MKSRTVPVLVLALVAASAMTVGTKALDRGRSAALSTGTTADLIVIDKSDRTLKIFRTGCELKTYLVALGRNPVGAKEQEGDGRTPEGEYKIDFRKEDSAFHRALHVSYPTPGERARAKKQGVSPGGDIMIHGLPNGMGPLGSLHRTRDWTEGCIAVTNEEIEELWRVVPNGTTVKITP
jgi:murein L,D-transpeptidase YafK